ncbi:hypothetical protein ACFVR2_06450 [Gottfriedia sp. NPDC057991]|uniref:hypothetical protein n=1 Tax=Gottfriedia sp. NPDC057991 TaxID=3346298 RepID=UPI0036DB0BDD
MSNQSGIPEVERESLIIVFVNETTIAHTNVLTEKGVIDERVVFRSRNTNRNNVIAPCKMNHFFCSYCLNDSNLCI